jgi:hypothetical protein
LVFKAKKKEKKKMNREEEKLAELRFLAPPALCAIIYAAIVINSHEVGADERHAKQPPYSPYGIFDRSTL